MARWRSFKRAPHEGDAALAPARASITKQAALHGEVSPSPTELDEALHLQLEAARYFLEVLLDLFGKMGPRDASPSKAELPPLGSEEHVLLVASTAERRLVSFGTHVLRDYLSTHEAAMGGGPQASLATQVLLELTPSVVTLLDGILELHEHQFVRHLPGFYPLFVDLMHCDSKDIRQTLRDLFSLRIGSVLHEKQQAA